MTLLSVGMGNVGVGLCNCGTGVSGRDSDFRDLMRGVKYGTIRFDTHHLKLREVQVSRCGR